MRDQRNPQLSLANKKLETRKALFKLRGLFVCAEKYTLVPLQADEPISSFGGGSCAKGVCATCVCGRYV